MSDFADEYQKLNDAQRQAVDTIEGPLLVLAGPGTGKTQLLSARVANILTKTDTSPANITCLTFTVNAANNMRDRLRGMIGTDANQVVIKTFHSLAADIIAANPEQFYAGAVLNPVSKFAAQEIMLSIFDKLPHSSPLASKYDGKFTYLRMSLDAISKAKDAGLSPDKLKTLLNSYDEEIDDIEQDIVDIFPDRLSHKSLGKLLGDIGQLAVQKPGPLSESIYRLAEEAIEADQPTGKCTQIGKLKSKLLSNENGQKRMSRQRKANKWWLALCSVYEQYQAILYKRGYLDYSDMLIGVIEALQTNEDLRLDLQESIQYLLIDEFQDSNKSQIALMHLLTDNPHIEAPNIMVVGDPNQTIYGFNGAMLTNTEDFQNHYGQHLSTVDLTDNYRSSQDILDTAQKVITPYSSFHPKLSAKNEPKNTSVTFTEFTTEADQAVAIREQVESLLKADNQDSIAVLARGHKSLTYLSRYLTHAGFLVNYDQNIDVRETSCSRLVVSVLSLIHAITGGNREMVNYHLSQLLRHPVFAIEPADIWQIALAANRKNDWLQIAGSSPSTASIVTWLNGLVSVASSQSIDVLLEQILTSEFQPDTNLYQKFYEGKVSEESLIEATATRQLIEIAKQYAQTDSVSLEAFLDMFKATDNSLFLFSPSVGRYEKALTLMSVHGAKGLEFDHVFIIDADESKWKPGRQQYPVPLSLPIHLNLDSASDYARLMYVAMTRAKKSLHTAYVSHSDSKTKSLPAEQIAIFEFDQGKSAAVQDITATESVQLAPARPTDKTMRELLASKLDGYTLSATSLTNFLDICSNDISLFIEDNLVRVPQPLSESFIRGNSMHAAMELAQIQTTNGKLDIPAIKRLAALKISEEALSTNEKNKLIARAHEQIDTLFGLGMKFDPRSKPEQSFSAITQSSIPLYGKIDRIDTIDDHTICIVDYKTGRPITNLASRDQLTRLKLWRHRMQLGFYALLIKQQKSFKDKTICAQIIQLDATEADHLVLNFDFEPEELERLEKLALSVFTHIKQLNFPDVSSFSKDLKGILEFENALLDGKL